jgi:hypothetical protein
MSIAVFLLALIAGSLVTEAALTHLAKPLVSWKTQLGCGTIACAGLKRNNELVLSVNGTKLYVTLDDGSVAVLDASTGSKMPSYVPLVKDKGWTVSNIGSGVSVSQIVGNLVYAVQDSPPPFKWNDTWWYRYEGWFQSGVYNNKLLTTLPPLYYPKPVELSRIINLDSNGKERWTFPLQGFVVGTPLHGGRDVNSTSKLVYVLYNVNNIGRFTVLREVTNTNGTMTVQVLYMENSTFGYPYSPMRIVRLPKQQQDVLYWFETMNTVPGFDQRGRVHRISVNITSLRIISTQGRQELVGSASRPLLNTNGSSIWAGGHRSRIHKLSWQSDGPMWKGANSSVAWSIQMDQSLRNSTMPLMASPVMSSDDKLLFVPSTSTSFYCINAITGATVWKLKHSKRSIYMAEAKISPDNAVVYSILHMDGTVIAQDTQTGSILWEVGCVTISGIPGCYDSVEAEFILSPDGTKLYYGDYKGNIVSLTVATFTLPLPNNVGSNSDYYTGGVISSVVNFAT